MCRKPEKPALHRILCVKYQAAKNHQQQEINDDDNNNTDNFDIWLHVKKHMEELARLEGGDTEKQMVKLDDKKERKEALEVEIDNTPPGKKKEERPEDPIPRTTTRPAQPTS